MKKLIIFIFIITMGLYLFSGNSFAEGDYPTKTIEVFVGYPAGSSADILARIMAEHLSKELGQSVIVLNKVGGGGSIAGNALVKTKPDGYTIGIFASPQTVPECMLNPQRFIYKAKDISSVAQFSAWIPGIFVNYDSPFKSGKELVEYAKKNPDELRWGHPGRGNFYHIIGNLFIEEAKIKMLDVAFQSDSQNVAALLGKHIDLAVLTCGAAAVGHIKANKIRPLFLTYPRKFELLPDVPTAREAGFKLDIPDSYLGLFVPTGVPKEVTKKLSATVKKVTEDPEFKAKVAKTWFPIFYRDTDDFEKYVKGTIAEFLCKYSKKYR